MKTITRMRFPLSVITSLVTFTFLHGPSAMAQTKDKKLVELGWDIPDTAVMRQNITKMEQSPFDGCIFFAFYTREDGTKGNLSREVWSRKAVSEDALKPAIADLKATSFKRFTENFLRIDTMPANLGWNDDFSAVISNFRLCARIAKQGGVRGIFLDTEEYSGRIFDSLRQTDRKSFTEATKQARKRGKEIMEAIQEEYPNITILLSHGYSLPWTRSDGGKKKIPGTTYDLLPGFIDGLVDGAKGETQIVDGYEPSYYFDRRGQFDVAYRAVKKDVLPLVGDRGRYGRRVSVGFGLWMDRDWEKRGGWNESDFSKNFFTPDSFEKFTAKALQTSDKYVWVYTQKVNWWTGKSLPAPYADALRNARQNNDKDKQ